MREILTLAACAALCCAGNTHAATALGLTAEEMTQLYGAGFAKQTTEAQKLMDEEWDADMEEETAAEPAPEPAAEPEKPSAEPTPAPAPAPETPAVEPKPSEPQAEPAAEKPEAPKPAQEAGKKVEKKKVLKNTIMLVKAKRAVDAKIKYSRNNIANLRKKLRGLAKKYNVEPAENRSGGEYSSDLSNIDLTVIKNSQRAIENYKAAVPQLWAFSNELKEHIDKGMAVIGKSKNKVLLSYNPEDMQPADGSEAEKDPIDKFNYKGW